MTHHKRRSGRIAQEIPIVLLGTDATGKVFSEETKTVVLSRHGAGIISRYAFSPDEVLTLRLPRSTQEAEIRLVGRIGGEPGRHVYGVAFVDPELRFWPMEFPPPETDEPMSQRMTLECTLCQARENVEPSAIEEDVYSVNGNVLRYCERCGTATSWKLPHGASSAAATIPTASSAISVTSAATFPLPTNSVAGKSGPATTVPVHSVPGVSVPVSRPAVPLFDSRDPARPSEALNSEPAYSGSFEPSSLAAFGSTTYSTAALETLPTAAASTIVADAPIPVPNLHDAKPEAAASARGVDANGRRVNRRKHMRIRVNFSACVRHAARGDEIVECVNVSKGGLCFHSRRQYAVDSLIEIAAPYSPGEAALFVVARIKRVEPLSGGQVFRYGVAYVKPSSPGSSF